ncbi:hypothetical protein QVD17_09477 [Tagetes erecta]|uniref:Uncharacterized protein n=1 Tax=Tagetes erecta TaxID=13708 RepID=A0AAD8L7F1_TARER|nr:hypothetical protein QVD17_09477 [Tagetes erecta]
MLDDVLMWLHCNGCLIMLTLYLHDADLESQLANDIMLCASIFFLFICLEFVTDIEWGKCIELVRTFVLVMFSLVVQQFNFLF